MDDAQPTTPPPVPPRAPRPRIARTLVVALAALAVVVGGVAAFLHTETALELAIAQAEHASGGTLRIENASGTLLSTIRAKRIAWNGATATVVAEDVALDWSPRALFSGRVAIRGLGAGRLAFETRPSPGPAELPDTLALPIEVEIDRLAVGRLDWRVAGRSGTVTGLAFAYAGGAREHVVRDLALVFDAGTLAGRATLGANPPYAVDAALGFAGNASVREARANASLAGSLREIEARLEGRAADATASARAKVRPLEDPPLVALDVDARAVDLAAFEASLPRTRLDVRVQAAPDGRGLAGAARATNAEPGTWDAKRLPLDALAARFALSPAELALDDLVATLPGGGRASGRGGIAIGRDSAGGSRWSLDVRDLDLARVHGRLAATRLSGRVRADVGERRQVVEADLSQQDLGLAFDATVEGSRVDAPRIRARAGPGRFEGRASFVLDGARPFDVQGSVEKLDPARFGQFPAGTLTGTLAVRGTLQPTWSAQGTVSLAQGSVLSGVALSGRAGGTAQPGRVRDASLDVAVGRGHVKATGSAGAPGDALDYAVDALDLGDVAKLLPGRVPDPLAGVVRARGTLAVEPASPGGTADLAIDKLRVAGYGADRLQGRVEVAPGGVAVVPLENRKVVLKLKASGVKAGGRALSSASVDAEGTLAAHRASASIEGAGLALSARAHGSARATSGTDAIAWSGTVDALDNGGRWPFRLESPATVSYERGRVATGPFAIAVADGHVRVRDLAIEQGRVTTHGEFDGVAVATAARLAGWRPPLATDLVLAGDWSIAATPRLNGTVRVRRQSGDVFASDPDSPDATPFAFGLTSAAFDAKIVDDAVDATLDVRASRAGNAQARASIGVAQGAEPGRIGADAPLSATLAVELPTLRGLQPFLGTNAVVDGRVRLDATARGRLADPALAFDLAGEGLRVSAPQYGVQLTDGRLRARDENGKIVLTEFTIRGGDGTFSASGTLATLGRDGEQVAADARVAWKAERFRLLNRPNMRLVVEGSGTLGNDGRKLALAGSLTALQGHFEYARTGTAELSDDVVIVGADSTRAPHPAAATSPLALDLELDLGDAFTFSGEGLETGLRGRVRVTTGPNGQLVGRGTIRAVNGTYTAFGQRLTIDRGSLIFDGPLSNPALDIVALRKNQPVEAGVAVTGTVRVPVVTLVSNPPVPDSEKLSWLILGRSGEAQSGADAAALQVAAAALLSRGGKPLTTQIAQKFGLDDITFGSTTGVPSTGTAQHGGVGGTLQNQVVVFGKRISDRLSVAYQQGLNAASNALVLNYALTRTLTVRLEAGVISSVGIYYRRSFD